MRANWWRWVEKILQPVSSNMRGEGGMYVRLIINETFLNAYQARCFSFVFNEENIFSFSGRAPLTWLSAVL